MKEYLQADLAKFGPDARVESKLTLEVARTYCRELTRSHYENFNVSHFLLPRQLRQHFCNLYAYCRWADDLADEIPQQEESLRLLDWWERQVDELYEGGDPTLARRASEGIPVAPSLARRASVPVHPVFIALADTVHEFELPRDPLLDLLSAFRQDRQKACYETFEELLDYCRRSANPVGRLVLHLGDCHNEETARLSDSICTGLQLANFWQDVRRDFENGRTYLPREDLQRVGAATADLAVWATTENFRELMKFEVQRAEEFLLAGEPLVKRVTPQLRVSVRLFIDGGMAILAAIRRQRYDVWSRRPVVGKVEEAAAAGGGLLAAKFMKNDLETSYRHCRAVVRRASSNLASTFWLLPAEQRRGMDALYAFARQADDLVDSDEPPEIRRQQLAAFRRAVSIRLTGQGAGPFSYVHRGPLALLPALEETVQRFKIPPEHLLELLDGVEMDLDQSSYATFEELRTYCYRVASVVGMACLPLWGCRDERATHPAIDCGLAFQLTNILRDIREDAERGRVYLPAAELARFGLSSADILSCRNDAGWQEFLQFQTARAQSFFESGAATSRYLPPAGRRVFRLMLARYQAILTEVKRRGTDMLRERVQLSFPRKLLIAAGALVGSGMVFAPKNSVSPTNIAAETLPGPVVPTVAIVGGGLAGLAAAAALCERGYRVDIYEARRRLGGRAGSYVDKDSGDAIDHCQHVAMGCCTSFLDLGRRTGILDLFERHRTLHFFGPEGQRCEFGASNWLPAPLHLGPAFLGLSYLSFAERLSIAATLLKLSHLPAKEQPGEMTIGQWLQEQKQSLRAVARFWQVVLVSALGESLDRASLTAARKVFVDGFMSARSASDVWIPKVPLAELYERIAEWLTKRGVSIHLGTLVERIAKEAGGDFSLASKDGTLPRAGAVICAIPWRHAANILPEEVARQNPIIHSAPITSLHLWFDRPITELPHAVLVGRLSQWVFGRRQESGARDQGSGGHRSWARVSDPAHTADRRSPDGAGDLRSNVAAGSETRAEQGHAQSQESGGHYYQVVISASHELSERSREDVLREVREDLDTVFLAAKDATLLRWQMITEPEAVFSVRPGLEALRPAQRTSIPNLFLAGDWTATGWPSTMESAVRSGYLAAEAVLHAAGRENRLVK